MLSSDPLSIYGYVRNTIDYEPYYGSRKGATGTLETKAGNDVDQASLLIALLRKNNIPARYVTGTVEISSDKAMNWAGATTPEAAARILASGGTPVATVVSGGQITALRLQHTWAEAYVTYENYRGRAPGKGQKIWVPLDPSFKQYEIKTGLELAQISGLEQQSINDLVISIGDLSSDNQREALTKTEEVNQIIQTAANNLTTYIQNNGLESSTLADLIGGRAIIPEQLKVLPASLPHKLLAITGEHQSLPTNLTDYISIAVGGADPFGLEFGTETDFTHQASAPELYGKKITLSWIPATSEDENVINQYGGIFKTPAYLVKMTPQLKIDGQLIASGSPISLGYRQNFIISIKPAGRYEEIVENPVTVGGFYCLGLDYQSIAPAELTEISNRLKQYETTANESNVYTDEILGEMLNAVAKAYFAELDLFNNITAQQCQVKATRQLSEAVTGYGPKVGYMFNSPVEVKEGSLFIDVDRDITSVVSTNSTKEKEKAYMLISGVTASFMEHSILEQVTGIPSLSTIKILNEATTRGIPILTITRENQAELLPALKVSQSVKNDIQNAVNAGQTVVIPQQEINYYDWKGSGYIVLDPDTGAAGYMISGGMAGGSTSLKTTLILIAGLIAGLIMVVVSIITACQALAGAIFLIALVCYALTLWMLCMSIYYAVLYWCGDTQAEQEALARAVANIAALFLSPLAGKLLSPVLERLMGTAIGRLILDLLDDAGNAVARRIISHGFSEEFVENIIRISGSKSLVPAQKAIDELLNLGVSKNLIKEVGERFGQEGLTVLARLIKTGGVTEGEISTLLNAGYDMARLEMLAEDNLIQAAVEAVTKVDAAMNKINATRVFNKTAEQINEFWRLQGYTNPPYMVNSVVKEFTLAETTQFVRVYDNSTSFMRGGWVMKADDVTGLTAEQIKDKFALQYLPKYICDVEVEAGAKMHCGVAGEIPGWGKGGGIQFDMNNSRTAGSFFNERLIY